MNYRKITAGILSLIMLASAASCGKEEAPAVPEDIPVSASSEESAEVSAEEPAEESTEPEQTAESTKATKKKKEKQTETTADVTAGKADTTTRVTKSTGYAVGGKPIKASDAKKDDGTTAKSSQNDSATTAAKSEKPTDAPAEPAEKQFDAEITFSGDVTVDGKNASADGSVVRITAGGDYIVRGSSANGQIYVNAPGEEKVDITLDGVNIAHSDGPAIFIDNAKKCTIKLAEGSFNRISDDGKDKVNHGAIFSNDTLRIKGSGSLEINAGNAHGIASDDDIIIDGGEFRISSKKSGMIANDDITINDGTLTVFGGTNGLKSKGTMNINGGAMYICGGVKEEKSSIYAESGLYYTGGYVYAVGNMVTAPESTPNPYIVVNMPKGEEGDRSVVFVLDGGERAVLQPINPFKCMMMLSPDIAPGATFTPNIGGSSKGDFGISDGLNLFTVE